MIKYENLSKETQNKVDKALDILKKIVVLENVKAFIKKQTADENIFHLLSEDDKQVILRRIDIEIKVIKKEIREETQNLRKQLGLE